MPIKQASNSVIFKVSKTISRTFNQLIAYCLCPPQLKGGAAIENLSESFSVVRSLPHGHVAAVLGTLKKLNLHNLIAPDSSRKRALVLAMIVARILDPRSKLATARGLNSSLCFSSLSELLGLEKADEDELYEAMDWLTSRQELIENELAKIHLTSAI